MFFDLGRRGKRIAAALISIFTYAGLSVISWFILRDGIEWAGGFAGVWQAAIHWWWIKLLLCFLIVWLMVYRKSSSLDIKAVRVGHGQHGAAAYMTDHDADKVYRQVPFGQEAEPGLLVGVGAAKWRIDTSDQNVMINAPPGAGKTMGEIIPTVYYNAQVNRNRAGSGASMLLVDIKRTLYDNCSQFLRDAGYHTPLLDFREVLKSSHYNLLYKVNKAIDAYQAAKTQSEQAMYYGHAEREAKVVAGALIGSDRITVRSEAGDYFTETSRGLLIGIILLVSQYAREDERHIISVYQTLLGCGSGLMWQDVVGESAGALHELLAVTDNIRIRNYVGAAMSADARTWNNILSTVLGKLTKFIDAELEQIVTDHGDELAARDFIARPTAIFISCPDENSTRHFFASLFIRAFANDLIELAETRYQGKLPRPVYFFLDEFGNLPEISDVDMLFSAFRSRGARMVIAIQSFAQLQKHYSKERAQIIQDSCQMVMSTFVSPSSYETARNISEMLGNETILTGSVNINDRRDVSASKSMVGRRLLPVAEMITISFGTWIVQKGGSRPFKTQLPHQAEYLKIQPSPVPRAEQPYRIIQSVDAATLAARLGGFFVPLMAGMFDGPSEDWALDLIG